MMRFALRVCLPPVAMVLSLYLPLVAQFETRSSVAVLQGPAAIAVGDFNHDGKLDLAVASSNSSANQITILLGNGDGTFGTGPHYNVVPVLYSIATADFNRDGNLDLVVADYLNSQVSVLLGNGDGTFQAAVSYPVPPGPKFVLAGDFNGDGWTDIASLEYTNSCFCISLLLNNKSGTFGNVITTSVPYPYAMAMTAGDFDGDGTLDLATTGWDTTLTTINILHGNGDGTFSFGANYNGIYSERIINADLRNNGKLDLIVANFQLPNSVYVFLGNGDGTFESPMGYPAGTPGGLATADFNGDGKLDLAVADNSSPHIGAVTVMLGNGDGTFEPGTNYLNGGRDSVFVVAGDFNGDKRPDLAVAISEPAGNTTVLLNTGVVCFSPTTPLNFKKVKVGTTSAPQTVTLTNTGKSALTISSMKTTGQFAETNTCGSSVAAGANCSISVTFSPTSTGPKSGTVTVHDSASSKPMVIELSGTGD